MTSTALDLATIMDALTVRTSGDRVDNHMCCEPCTHSASRPWYQISHCRECLTSWPCDTATLVSVRNFLAGLSNARCPIDGLTTRHTYLGLGRYAHLPDTIVPHEWPPQTEGDA